MKENGQLIKKRLACLETGNDGNPTRKVLGQQSKVSRLSKAPGDAFANLRLPRLVHSGIVHLDERVDPSTHGHRSGHAFPFAQFQNHIRHSAHDESDLALGLTERFQSELLGFREVLEDDVEERLVRDAVACRASSCGPGAGGAADVAPASPRFEPVNELVNIWAQSRRERLLRRVHTDTSTAGNACELTSKTAEHDV